MSAVLLAYMGLVTLAVIVGALLNPLLDRRPATARYAVSFSAGVMLAVCLLYLIPDALTFAHGIRAPRPGTPDYVHVGYALSLGFLALLTVERFLLRAHHHDHGGPGAHARGHDCAHDHEPPHHHLHDPLDLRHRHASVVLSTVVALCLHALFDGVALYAAGVMPAMGPALATAVILHKMPEAATVLTVLRRGGAAPRPRLWGLLVYAACTPLGMVVAAQLLRVLSEQGVALLMAFVAGSLLHLVTGHLLPEATAHSDGDAGVGRAFFVMLAGFAMLLLARALGGGP